jgi:hypothetical protein
MIACYVLTTNGNDVMADLNLISVWSLQQSNPDAYVVLLCDRESAEALQRTGHPLRTAVDEVLAIETPAGSPAFRNRFVKTSMRKHVSGPFLYLDADTLIRGDLSSVFAIQSHFAAAPNLSGTEISSQISSWETWVFDTMRWQMPTLLFVNGGVLFFSDHQETHALSDLWHWKWRECTERMGMQYDQPSLNSALHETGIVVEQLAHRFNAQVLARPKTAWGAVIWHFYLSFDLTLPKTVLNEALLRFRKSNDFSAQDVARLCERDHPWVVKNPIDWIVVQRFRRDVSLSYWSNDNWERLWLADQYTQALKQFVLRTPLWRFFCL